MQDDVVRSIVSFFGFEMCGGIRCLVPLSPTTTTALSHLDLMSIVVDRTMAENLSMFKEAEDSFAN